MSVTLHLRHGDCLVRLQELGEGSVGAVVCDPPYDLTAVSRGGSSRTFVDNPYGRARVGTDRGGFMGKTWDGTGIAFSPDLWSECYRILVFGGAVKAFGGTRTFHRMAAAMQEAGFTDIRLEAWNYGSGFPKSLSISKAIDKAAGAEREVMGTVKGMGKQNPEWNGTAQGRAENSFKPEYALTTPATDAARTWEGWGTALKPSWEPVLVGMKPE